MPAPVFISPSTSRPKVHRPPPRLVHEASPSASVRFVLNYGPHARFTLSLASAALIAIVVSLALFRFSLPGSSGPEVIASSNEEIEAERTLSGQPVGEAIVLTDKEGSIVGQMARISSAPPVPVDVTVESPPVDKRKGRELLSIVNQY